MDSLRHRGASILFQLEGLSTWLLGDNKDLNSGPDCKPLIGRRQRRKWLSWLSRRLPVGPYYGLQACNLSLPRGRLINSTRVLLKLRTLEPDNKVKAGTIETTNNTGLREIGSMTRPLHLAILMCGNPVEAVRAEFGTYGDIFEQRLLQGLEARGKDAPSLDLKITKWNVFAFSEYPNIGDVDALLLTEARACSFAPTFVVDC